MKTWDKLKRLWVLAEYEPVQNTGDLITEEGQTAVLDKKPSKLKEVFVPRVIRSPIEELVNQSPHE